MPTKTWYLRQVNVGGTPTNRLWWDEEVPTQVSQISISTTGWNVGNEPIGDYALLNNGTEVPRGAAFTTTIQPTNTAPTVDVSYAATAVLTPPTLLVSTDSISTLYEYTGVFPSGDWVFTFPVRAGVTGNQDGRINMRVFRGTRSGTAWTNVTELTSAILVGTAVSNLTSTGTQNSTVTWTSAPAFKLQNEFLICKIAWEITGTGGNNNRTVFLTHGRDASFAATMVTPSFRKQRALLDL